MDWKSIGLVLLAVAITPNCYAEVKSGYDHVCSIDFQQGLDENGSSNKWINQPKSFHLRMENKPCKKESQSQEFELCNVVTIKSNHKLLPNNEVSFSKHSIFSFATTPAQINLSPSGKFTMSALVFSDAEQTIHASYTMFGECFEVGPSN